MPPATITRPPEPNWPVEVQAARDLHERALHDALNLWRDHRQERASSTTTRQIVSGILAVTVTRRDAGDYRARWTINQNQISRLDAEAHLARHQEWVRTGKHPEEAAE